MNNQYSSKHLFLKRLFLYEALAISPDPFSTKVYLPLHHYRYVLSIQARKLSPSLLVLHFPGPRNSKNGVSLYFFHHPFSAGALATSDGPTEARRKQ